MTRGRVTGKLVRLGDPEADDPNVLRIVERGVPEDPTVAGRREAQSAENTQRHAQKPLTRKRKAELMREAQRLYWTALPEVVQGMVDGASKGRATSLKLLLELGGLGPGAMARQKAVKKAKDWDAVLLAAIRRGHEEAAANEVRRQETLARNLRQLEEEERRAATEEGGVDGVLSRSTVWVRVQWKAGEVNRRHERGRGRRCRYARRSGRMVRPGRCMGRCASRGGR